MIVDVIAERYGLDADRLPVQLMHWSDHGQRYYTLGPARFALTRDGALHLELPDCDECSAQPGTHVHAIPAPASIAGLLDEFTACPSCQRPFQNLPGVLADLLAEYLADALVRS